MTRSSSGQIPAHRGARRSIGAIGRPAAAVGAMAATRLTIFAFLVMPLALETRLTIFIRKRAMDQFASVDGFAALQAGLVGAMCLVLLITPRMKPLCRGVFRTSVGALLVFYGVCGFSAVWSGKPAYTVYRSLEVVSTFMMIVLAVRCCRTFRGAEKLALWMTILVIALDLAGAIRRGGFGNLHTNTYSAAASMGVCYCFGEIFRAHGRRRKYLVMMMVMCIAALAAGTCSSSNIGTVCGIVAAGVLKQSKVRSAMVVVLLVALLLFATGLYGEIEAAVYRVLLPGKSPDSVSGLTGRTRIWTWAINEIKKDPIFGKGFAVSARMSRIAANAHNTILTIMLDTGIIGLLAFIFAAGLLFAEVYRLSAAPIHGLSGCWCAFVAAFVNCMGVPFLGTIWKAPMFSFALFAGLYVAFVLPGGVRFRRQSYAMAAARRLRAEQMRNLRAMNMPPMGDRS